MFRKCSLKVWTSTMISSKYTRHSDHRWLAKTRSISLCSLLLCQLMKGWWCNNVISLDYQFSVGRSVKDKIGVSKGLRNWEVASIFTRDGSHDFTLCHALFHLIHPLPVGFLYLHGVLHVCSASCRLVFWQVCSSSYHTHVGDLIHYR